MTSRSPEQHSPAPAPTARYNRPPKAGSAIAGKLIAVAAVVFVVIAGIVIYQYFHKVNAATVSATTAGFSRVDDRTLKISVDVTRKNTEQPSYCIVTALNYDKAEVGRREFLIEPGGQRTERFSVDIPSRDLPVAGTVYGCADNPPAYLTATAG